MQTAKNPKKLQNIIALFLPEVRELLEKKNFSELKNLLKRVHSVDLAEGWPLLTDQERVIIFKLLTQRKTIEVFEDLKFEEQEHLLNNLDNTVIADILNEMAPDERADLFKDLSSKTVKKLFSLMKKEEVDDVKKLLTFEEETAGSLMSTEFVTLKKDMTCKRAIIYLQEKYKSEHGEKIYSIYVTDDEHKLLGGATLQQLIISPPDMLIKDAMQEVTLVKVHVNTTEEEVAHHFSKYDLLDAPIVNEQNQLVGIITVDDVVDLMEREATKEVYEIGKMSGEGGEEIRYASASMGELVRRRAPWLMFLLVFDFLTGTVLKTFEHALGTVVALTFFIPMLLDTGGNAGNQAAITIIRGFATGDVTFKNIWRIARLEILTAFLMGLIVGIVAFIRAMLMQGELMLALVVGSTMAIIILLAILTGIFLPIISKRFGLDPAVLAGPITTSFIDVIGLIIYFKIAQHLIPALR